MIKNISPILPILFAQFLLLGEKTLWNTHTHGRYFRECTVVSELVERDYRIVGGLAVGCDTAAHIKCLDCGGKTIAFLPYQKNSENIVKANLLNL